MLWVVLAAGGSTHAAPNTQVRLLLSCNSVRPGDTVLAGVELRMPAGWHTYWRNPGDSGQATHIEWSLPDQVTAGEVEWPLPEKLVAPPLTTYVYSSNVVLLVPLRFSAGMTPGSYPLRASVSWLECGRICLPGKAVVLARLEVGVETRLSPDAEFLKSWQVRRSMQAPPTLPFNAVWEKPAQDDLRPLIIGIRPETGAEVPSVLDFYPYSSEQYEVRGETDIVPAGIRKLVRTLGGGSPKSLPGIVLVRLRPNAPLTAFEVLLGPGEL